MKKKVFQLSLALLSILWLSLTMVVSTGAKASQKMPLVPEPTQRGPGYDPNRITVCQEGCQFTTLKEAVDAIEPNSEDIISILDGIIQEKSITIDNGKTVTIIGLGKNRTKIGIIPTNTASEEEPTRTFTISGESAVTLKELTLYGGDALDEYGGAIHISGTGSTLTLEQVALLSNKAKSGGAIAALNGASVQLDQVVIEGNEAAELGGGIYLDDGQLTLKRSFIGHNSATAGGGIYFSSSSAVVQIVNSTIGLNTAEGSDQSETSARGGAGIYMTDPISDSTEALLDMQFSTLSGNHTVDGNAGGLVVDGGVVSMTASIMLNNHNQSALDQSCEVLDGSLSSAGYNLAANASCQLGATDVISDVAIMGQLGNWGGPTPTFEVVTETLAIGIVPLELCSEMDQRDLIRIADDQCDAGAYEAEKFTTFCTEGSCTTTRIKPDRWVVTENDDPEPDGCQVDDCSLREAIIAAEAYPGRDEIVFDTAGPISLTRQGMEGAEEGDLDIIGELSLMGNITDVITIDATGLDDRIFEIGFGSNVEMTGFKLTGGNVVSGARGGGAILNQGVFVGEHLLIRENQTNLPNFGWGGAIQNAEAADFTLRNSEIISNSTNSFFSGVANWNSTMELTGVTIAGNNGANGVIYNLAAGGDSVLWLNSVTVAANGTDAVYGLSNRWQDLSDQPENPEAVITYVHNSILGEHSQSSCDASGSLGNNIAQIVSLNYNLSFDDTCQLDKEGDMVDTDPLLEPLSVDANGKYNDRLILRPSPLSPIYNNGDIAGCPDEDGRGIGRPDNGRCDIGSIELDGDEGPSIIYLPSIQN